MLFILYLISGAIARGSYVVPTANPLLDTMRRLQQQDDEGAGTTTRATMTLQQTLQSVQLLTRQHAHREEGRDNVRK